MSMASTIAPSIAASDKTDSNTLVHRPSVARSVESERPATAKVRPPLVYPALLSRVAECFKQKIITGDKTKNGLTYKNAFTGSEAVDVLSYIIRTTDRNLALLLGRALDAQKFFHDVTYEHRLRDSSTEMYQFKETMTEEQEDAGTAVNGVFVLLSECYSPTCTRDQLCYSIACPRRLEQVSRLNLKMGPGLKDESAPVVGEDDIDQTDEQKLWINTVPKEIAERVSDKEKKRQEVISEICYTERDFVRILSICVTFGSIHYGPKTLLLLRTEGRRLCAKFSATLLTTLRFTASALALPSLLRTDNKRIRLSLTLATFLGVRSPV
ncbi:hypothetical protein MCOR02_000275 [Pyricularia oryzae]|nr:hypothetical protein MCOR02_000275 [Pyricularia oryzae]